MSQFGNDFNIHPVQDVGTNAAYENYTRLLQLGAQQQALREQSIHQANMLQMAQAQQVARGQSATSQNFGGVSPIAQSVLKSKALVASSLDRNALKPDQQQLLDQMTRDPNIDYKTFTQGVEQLRQGMGANRRQENFETRQQGIQGRDQERQQRAANQAKLRDVAGQMKQIDTQFRPYGLDPESDPSPGETADMSAARAQYKALKAQHDALIQGAFTDQGNPPPGGDGTDDQQTGSEFKPGTGTIQGYGFKSTLANGKVTRERLPTATTQNQNSQSPQTQSRGKMTIENMKQYLQQAGGNKAKAQAMAKQDGWSW